MNSMEFYTDLQNDKPLPLATKRSYRSTNDVDFDMTDFYVATNKTF